MDAYFMLRLSLGLFVAFLSVGCTDRPTARVEKPSLDVAARVYVLRPADHVEGAIVAIAFETKHALEPRLFPLDCSDFPPDFRPELRLTFLVDRAPLGEPKPIPFKPDC